MQKAEVNLQDGDLSGQSCQSCQCCHSCQSLRVPGTSETCPSQLETLTDLQKLANRPRIVREIVKIPGLKQIFFDCDNTLVMTEGIAFRQTAGLVNELMVIKGIEERYTGEKLIVSYIGMTFKEMLPELAELHEFELTAELTKHMVKREEEEVIKAIEKEAVPCEGIVEVLQQLKKEAKYPIAVVSSSSTERIVATLKKTDLLHYFDVIYSAKSSLPKPVGKPEPDVYLHAMKELGLKAGECLTVEDSRTGMAAALRAGIACVGYVGCYSGKIKQYQLEHDFAEMGGLTTIYEWKEFSEVLKKVTGS